MGHNKRISEEDWKEKLTAEQYKILRLKGTERAFTGKYWNTFKNGIYKCAGCNTPLFDSDTKFESSCGWPSFSAPKEEENIQEDLDTNHGMKRTEVLCQKCGGHLGHVFEDGPKPTGLRYCINSAALEFQEQTE